MTQAIKLPAGGCRDNQPRYIAPSIAPRQVKNCLVQVYE